MTQLATARKKSRADKQRTTETQKPEALLSEREGEALRLLRELAREAPRSVPVRPDRANKYLRPQ